MSRQRGGKNMLDDNFHPTAYQLATFTVPKAVKPKKERINSKKSRT